MIEVFTLGFLLGIRHAMESDHVAAVASLVGKSPTLQQSLRLGSAWGLGHTITLFLFGSAVLLLNKTIPEHIAATLEFIVGIMLVILGIDVIRRLIQERGKLQQQHIHPLASNHHKETFPLRALLVGMMHGMAGSAALILLTLQSSPSVAMGMVYILLFGIGSIIGMAFLSVIIMFPLRHSAQHYHNFNQYLQLSIGAFAVLIGINIMFIA